MLNLDQVRLLENRVEKAVSKIQTLTAENTHLCSQLSALQTRVNELEGLVRSFKDDQGRIEEGILSALDRLSAFEDSVYHAAEPVVLSQETSVTNVHIESSDTSEKNEIFSISDPETIQPDAEWQNPVEDKQKTSSSDGQMDIF